MGKYRYARANGQFLQTAFNNAIKEATAQNFRVDQSYNLLNNFSSGSVSTKNSFISSKKLTGYTAHPKSLLGWWRLNKDISTAGNGIDSSGNGNVLSPPSDPADRPSFDDGDTPSAFIQESSCLFSGAQVLEAADSSSFSFGNGSKDFPFSIALWAKFSSTGDSEYIVAKWDDAGTQREYLLWKPSTERITLELYDESSSGIAKAWTSDPVIMTSDWYHIVATYDGSGSGTGINIYINGSLVSTGESTSLYTAMENTAANLSLANRDDESASYAFSGNLADVAIWSRVLSSEDVAHLYGVKTAGAYQLVRDFENISLDNDTRILGVDSTKKGLDTGAFKASDMNQFVQGVHVKSISQLLDYNTMRIRSNSGFVNTFRGRDLPTSTFDDSLAPITLQSSGSAYTSGSNTVVSNTAMGGARGGVILGGAGRLSVRLSHEMEHRDLGQTVIYDTPGPFEDTLDLNPITIITKRPENIILPYQLVSQTSNEIMDGTIEPLTIRSIIDRSSIEGPFYSHAIWACLDGNLDPYRRNIEITDGRSMHDIRTAKGAAPWLDSVENLGGLDMPGAFSDSSAIIDPFVDYLNDRDKEYTNNNVSSTISAVLIHSSSWIDNDDRTHDKMAPHGFIFDNDPIGFDSIAYGGLKK